MSVFVSAGTVFLTTYLCFNYSPPKNPTTGATGSVKITLGLFQSGALLTSLVSPTLTSGTSYCFPITPLSLPGINAGVGYIDFMATGVFALAGTPPSSMAVGTAPGGQIAGTNSDYKIACAGTAVTTSKWCCPGANLVKNGDFESAPVGNTKPATWPNITSQYAVGTSVGVGATLPGQYNVVTGAQASGISTQWSAEDHSTCNAASGHFMVINGRTTQTTGSKTIWKQTVAVTGGKEYRFCVYVKNLPQCTFDIRPQIDVKFSDPGNTPIANITSTAVNLPGGQPCRWQLIATSFVVPIGVTSLTIDILLDEQGLGDGNDLALDDISLQEKPQVPANYVLINISTHNIGNGKYTIRADYPPNLPQTSNCGYLWDVCELDANDNCIAANKVSNPPAWWTFPNPLYNDFNGYNGNNSNLNGPSPGVFMIGKRYRITFAAWCDCEGLRQSSWLLQYNAALKKPQVTQMEVHD
ncbi:MAG: hypothetical protein AUJ92_02055 [Armatimonadetes bacterium CG2_30_59_28]|nr:MAG: hypothetical protein AUJ92_02055 [Armatimonadetes bacterium CG2_30_59_28]PIX42509.1 MAG: hypothetical protein COZ56_09245 [Armatimonadetes bacterium CG_4_8_14_3_um_filter_58_9]PJB62893.1 MAG: hypothetical protein CO095_17645 [Armatimonadetes bacterium CG_4_9_14_3_um_filter_58_7]